MQIRVKLMGMLKPKNPPGNVLDLAEGATIDEVLARLEIDPARVQVYTINGALERNRERVLQAGDEFSALPPVGGG